MTCSGAQGGGMSLVASEFSAFVLLSEKFSLGRVKGDDTNSASCLHSSGQQSHPTHIFSDAALGLG